MASLVREMSFSRPTRLLCEMVTAAGAAALFVAVACCIIVCAFGRWYAYRVPVVAASMSARLLHSIALRRTRRETEVERQTRWCSRTGRERQVGGSTSAVEAEEVASSSAAVAMAGRVE